MLKYDRLRPECLTLRTGSSIGMLKPKDGKVMARFSDNPNYIPNLTKRPTAIPFRFAVNVTAPGFNITTTKQG